MTNLLAQWAAAWNPYSDYAKGGGADQAIKIVAEEIGGTNIAKNLGELNTFYGEVDKYRNAAHRLRQSPVNGQLAQEVEGLHSAIVGQSRSFQAKAQLGLQSCAEVTAAMKTAAAAIAKDKAHVALAKGVLTAAVKISDKLKEDEEAFGTAKIGQTLDQIRRNA